MANGIGKKRSLEEESRKRLRRRKIENAVLNTLTATAGLAVAVTAPNMLRMLKHIDPDWRKKRDPRQRLFETASRLKRKGLVIFVQESGKTHMRITRHGREILRQDFLTPHSLPKPKKWDGRWRLVIFDIPETQRSVRDKIRSAITTFGFVCLQDSVWVYPYDCEELVALFKAELKIGKNLLYLIADAIEYDKPLRAKFGLPEQTS
ncbi:hypothetical protein H7X87_01280 [Acetobacteraceae bacterium]|nr:hypothetical protein [Candidatus Parcubacteria bacterium]